MSSHLTSRRENRKPLRNIVNFFFELGMLKRTPRSGYQFLGSGQESVADHSFRVALIGYTLSKLINYRDPFHVVCLCLFHDVPEARTGDLNYVNKQYVKINEDASVADLARLLPFGDDYKAFLNEFKEGQTDAAKLAHDADQLDLILELKEQSDLGNRYALKWIEFARKRLKTEIGKEIAREILTTDFSAWWFERYNDF